MTTFFCIAYLLGLGSIEEIFSHQSTIHPLLSYRQILHKLMLTTHGLIFCEFPSPSNILAKTRQTTHWPAAADSRML